MTEMETSVAARLRDLRRKRQITQDVLAEELRVSPITVYYWERGMVLPSLENAIMLASYYGVTLDYLAGREEERPPG